MPGKKDQAKSKWQTNDKCQEKNNYLKEKKALKESWRVLSKDKRIETMSLKHKKVFQTNEKRVSTMKIHPKKTKQNVYWKNVQITII